MPRKLKWRAQRLTASKVEERSLKKLKQGYLESAQRLTASKVEELDKLPEVCYVLSCAQRLTASKVEELGIPSI